jgi:hypothetical protein
MTFKEIIKKITTYWWLGLLIGGFAVAFLSQKSSAPQFVASKSYGLQYNDPQLDTKGDELYGYTQSLTDFSLYLKSRFTSVEIQDQIAKDMKISPRLNSVTAFYEVNNQNGGFVNLIYISSNKQEAENFLASSEKAYQNLVIEWNNSRPEPFTVTPQSNFTSSVVEMPAALQKTILPYITGVLLGLFVILVLPAKSVKEFKK